MSMTRDLVKEITISSELTFCNMHITTMGTYAIPDNKTYVLMYTMQDNKDIQFK